LLLLVISILIREIHDQQVHQTQEINQLLHQKCPPGESICNAYRIMRDAGFTDSGPDASDPSTYSWGMNALLTGPDPKRAQAAATMGNKFGFTDRLDYIFVKNGIKVLTSKMIGADSHHMALIMQE
jgi:hypothetical protein